MTWVENAIVWWSFDGGTEWHKVTDHNREPLGVTVERFEKRDRTVAGTLRRQTIAQKRSWNLSWNLVPSTNDNGGLTTADGGIAGMEILDFAETESDAFLMRVRKGLDKGKDIDDASIDEFSVMFVEHSMDVAKRGTVDLWNMNVRVEEV